MGEKELNRKEELESKMELERKMELRQRPPFWWPDSQVVMQLLLACAIIWMVGFILTQLFSSGTVKIDPSARDLVMVIIGIILGAFKDVFGFTFGSTAADKQKGEVINRRIETQDKIIAAGVETTANVAAAAVSASRPEEVIKTVVSWWSLLTAEEQAAIEAAAATDENIKMVLAKFKSGNAEISDLATLVAKGLLKEERSALIRTANTEIKPPSRSE